MPPIVFTQFIEDPLPLIRGRKHNTFCNLTYKHVYCHKNEQKMNTKLTLTIEKDVIKEAKQYAKDKGQSLSDLVENYFKLLIKDKRKIKPNQLSPRIKLERAKDNRSSH